MNPKLKKIFKHRKTGEKELNMWRAVARMNGIPLPETKQGEGFLDLNRSSSEETKK